MLLLFNIISAFLFLAWPMVLFTSLMMYDAPGSENDFKHHVIVTRVLCYPVYLSALHLLFGITFFGFSSITLFISSVFIVWYGLSIFNSVDPIVTLYESRINPQNNPTMLNRHSFMFWIYILALIFLGIDMRKRVDNK